MISITMYGAEWCPDCLRAKAFLEENKIDFTFINLDLDKSAAAEVERLNQGKRMIPTIIIGDQTYTNPDNAVLASVLGINDVGRIVLYGADWCPDCRRAKAYLQDNGISYQFIDIEQNDWAIETVEQINGGKRSIPTFQIDGVAYTNPDNVTLRDVLKIQEEKVDHCYDTIIIGAGAAGMTASIYAQRDRFNTLILERKNIGGNAFLTQTIENYPGFTSISGPDLMNRMAEQATTYGAEIKQGVEVTDIVRVDQNFQVVTNMGTFRGRSVVIAVGSSYRRLNIPGEEEMIGAGIHFCATCDGAFYRDRDIIVIGRGNSALEEGIFLAGFCKSVTIVSNNHAFSASDTYVEKLSSIDNITTHMNKTSIALEGDEHGNFRALKIRDCDTEEETEIVADGVFIFIGQIPNTSFLKPLITLDDRGFIQTKSGVVETDIPGIFAAGDCRKGALAQVASAVGEGVMASYGLRAYLRQ